MKLRKSQFDKLKRFGSKRSRLKISQVLFCLLVILLIVPIPDEATANSKFIISYDYPDNEGNGIAYVFSYYDGVFNATVYYNPTSYPNSTAVQPAIAPQGTNITIGVFSWLNGTLTGVSSLEEGKNVIRHNVTVYTNNGTLIFTKQNFTFIIGTDGDAPMYFYRYDVILDFVPIYGEIYTVVLRYDVFYSGGY